MKLKLAIIALAMAGSANAQSFQFNQVELTFEHSRTYANSLSISGHHYGGRADFSIGEDFGLQADLANNSSSSGESRWLTTVHGYARTGRTKYGLLIAKEFREGGNGAITLGGEAMFELGEKTDLQARLTRRETPGSSSTVYSAGLEGWYDITPQITLQGNLKYSTLSLGPIGVDAYTVGMGVEYELQRAPISFFGGVEHTFLDGGIPIDGVTTARVGMSFAYGKPAKRNTDRMFSPVKRGILF